MQQQGERPIPATINYETVPTLSREAREKLAVVQPHNLGQAARIPGVSPADITALLLWLELDTRRRLALASPGSGR